MPRDVHLRIGDEPPTPLWVEWRLAIYPMGLLCGALALAAPGWKFREVLFALFVLLMVLPLGLKVAAWGGVRRAWKWFMRRRLRVTTEGWFFLVLTILFGVAAINTGTNLLYLILSMMLSLIAVSGVMSELDVKGLRIARALPKQVFAGEQTRLGIVLQNPKRFVTSFAIDIQEEEGPFGEEAMPRPGPLGFAARLQPRERRVLTYRFAFPRRGVFPLRGFILSTRYPFGFFTKYAWAKLPGEVVVFPKPRELTPNAVALLGIAEESHRTNSVTHNPEEFRSLRPYRAGDNPRWIHWKSSARVGELVVREFEPRATRRATVVLDTCTGDLPQEPGPSGEPSDAVRALDRGTTLCASVTEHLARIGQRPEVVIPLEEDIVRFGSEGGTRSGAAVLDCLARAASTDDADFGHLLEAVRPGLRRGSRVVVLTARPIKPVRRAIEREEPAAAQSLQVLPFREPTDVFDLYVIEESQPGPTSYVARVTSRAARGGGSEPPALAPLTAGAARGTAR